MPNIDKHAPGNFCWVELATTDPSAAESFYSKIFGWAADNMPSAPGEIYTIFQLDRRQAAAASAIRPEQLRQGVRPHWGIYVAVQSADVCAVRAAELGGSVLAPPFDVGDVGRMAVLRDPAGAVFSVWQANVNPGIGIAGEHGTLCWCDLNTPDQARAGQFYADLFGWQIMKEDEETEHNYWHIKNGEELIVGIPPASHHRAGTPAHWLAYFNVSDCDVTAAEARKLGATLYLPPTDFEDVGRMAVLADPQGATFAIFKAAAHRAAAP